MVSALTRAHGSTEPSRNSRTASFEFSRRTGWSEGHASPPPFLRPSMGVGRRLDVPLSGRRGSPERAELAASNDSRLVVRCSRATPLGPRNRHKASRREFRAHVVCGTG